ncbi:MAG: hypothetical protein QOH61_1953, partial [Chloroflexota bacterium]|nr:hypothetical protein [Chloroflexota bacterium]
AHRVGLSQSTISALERGHLGRIAVRTITKTFETVGAELELDIRWRGAGVDRLLDERHARIGVAVVRYLVACGWAIKAEVSYSEWGERGSIDLLAWHEGSRKLLVIELKSELVSVEAPLRKLDEKARLAPQIARDRFGWRPRATAKLLVLPADRTERRRVQRAAGILDSALPHRTQAVAAWLRSPAGSIAGIWFVPDIDGSGTRSEPARRERTRRTTAAIPTHASTHAPEPRKVEVR